jgi:hypothetical protein
VGRNRDYWLFVLGIFLSLAIVFSFVEKACSQTPIIVISQAKDKVTLAWDYTDTNPDHFELEMRRDKTADKWAYSTLGTIRQLEILRPHSGVFVAAIRTCADSTCSKSSVWCTSIEPDCTGQKPFKIEFKPGSPMFLIGPH